MTEIPAESYATLAHLSNSLPTILAALDLAPVGLAAVAYRERQTEPFGDGHSDAWDRLETAVDEWRKAK